MDRLPVLSALAASSETDGRGFRAWRTRRANAYKQALTSLPKLAGNRDVIGAVLSFGEITEFLAPFLGEWRDLPRGYTFGRNRLNEPTFIAPSGDMLNPSPVEALPSVEVAQQFAHALRTGWLNELAIHVGLPGAYSFLEEAS
jgi:hypothetical protein